MRELQKDPREEVQRASIKAWVENDKIGTVVLATGFGKTRVGCIVAGEQLRKQKIEKILVVVPTTPLKEQ